MKIRVFYVTLVFILLVISACNSEIDPDNAVHKRKSDEYLRWLKSLHPSELNSININWLPTYADACKNNQPKFPKDRCINLVVVGKNNDEALRSKETVQALILKSGHGGNSSFQGLMISTNVLVPTKNCEGNITPYQMQNCYKSIAISVLTI